MVVSKCMHDVSEMSFFRYSGMSAESRNILTGRDVCYYVRAQ
jgi:hypothetical protein